MTSPLEIEDRGHVRILRLNRPERKNALSSGLGWAIVTAIEDAARDDDVWVIGLTGAGDAFCSGLDLAPEAQGDFESAAPLSPQDMAADELGWVGRFPVLMRERCEKLVVGGINGVAVGAGLSLAMATDIRIASDRARFLAGYARLGTSPDGGLTWTLAQAIGYERTLRFLLEHQQANAAEALEWGMVGEVAPADEFDARFLACCDRLAGVAPLAARATKRIVHAATAPPDVAAHVRWELSNARGGLDTEDGKEALAAFLEKRKPTFQGR
ncbi:MAG: enoyl-CoA hydratase/isomerase family protein [Deltaproteobacteria bacterium]|nr:enoyl-CoA hydratase/isomerase family protein [Deltaproteobacteria bacterium]MBW2447836.1 enoyl-CoA hydratase/isomerase family protein [Deltaproteobacteria bacterium]